MNILILNWRDPGHPLSGGAELSLLNHAKYWQSKGAKIIWYSSHFADAKKVEEIEGITCLRSGSHFTVHLRAFVDYLKGSFNNQDIVIDSFHFLPFLTPIYFRKVKIIALINETARELWFKNIFFPLNIIGYLIEPIFFLFYKHFQFITGSESAKNDLIQFGINNSKIHVINHGFNKPKKIDINLKEKNPTVLFLGRITQDKGIEDAVKAVRQIQHEIPKLQFWIGGKAENNHYLEKIKKMVNEYNLNSITTFFGYVTESQKYSLFSKAWVLVNPSLKEGWGLNIIEANASGTVAIGYTVPGLKDSIVNNKTGLLVGEVDYRNLALGLKKILTDQDLRKRLEKAALNRTNEYSWEKAGGQSWSVIKGKSIV